MADINNITLTGNLTKDPVCEIVQTKKGESTKARFSIAVSGWSKDMVDFINIEVWGKSAEYVDKYIRKGNKVSIIGSLSIQNYEKDGEKKQWVVVKANSLNNLTPKPKSDNQENGDVPF